MDFIEKIKNLPEDVRDYIGTNDVRLMLERACFMYGISEEGVEKLAIPVRDTFTKDILLSDLPLVIQEKLNTKKEISYGVAYELNNKIFSCFNEYFINASELLKKWENIKIEPLISEEAVWMEIRKIESWIVEEENERNHEIKKEVERLASLPLEQISDKYPEVLEQLLSNALIRLRKFSEPVRPSIKNWISDYHEQMGPGKHGTFDRGNYLFHSENTKALSSVERQKLSTILKSLDENTLLAIDPEKQEVVFDQETENSEQRTASNYQKSINSKQRPAVSEQQPINNFQQQAYKSQIPNQNTQVVDGMRIVKEAEKTLPAVGAVKPVQMQYQKPENVQPFKSQLVQGFGRTTAAPIMDTRRKVINPSESFGNYAIPEGDLVRKKPDVVKKEDNFPLRASYEAPRSPQVVEKKISTAPQNFGNDIAGFQKQQPQPAKKIFSESSQGGQQQGKVSFSSPQQLPVEKKQDSAKRTPFRIVPHGDL